MFETTDLVNKWTREISRVRTMAEGNAVAARIRRELGDNHPELWGLLEVLRNHLDHVGAS